MTCPLAHGALAVKPQFLCFHHVSAVAAAPRTFLALSYRFPRSLWSCALDTGSWRESREASQWLWVPFFSLPLAVTWCEGGNLVAVTAILFALSVFCLPCPSIYQGFAPCIFSTLMVGGRTFSQAKCVVIISLSHHGCIGQSLSLRKEVLHPCSISKLINS